MTGIFSVVGYLSGYVNLPEIFPFFGNTQFKVLCVIACISLSVTLGISCTFIKERDPRLDGPPAADSNPGLLSFFTQVFSSIRRLPPQISKVCQVQLFNWIGWFPFLFYITTYIGQLYVNPIFEEHPDLSEGEIDQAWERATRVGTFALLIFAITSFGANVILPFLIVPSYNKPLESAPTTPSWHAVSTPTYQHAVGTPGTRTPGTPGTLSASATSYFPTEYNDPKPVGVKHLLHYLRIPGLTLRRAWFMSHILFAACMWATLFTSTPKSATVLVALVGLSWALSLWAPFALISAEVSKRDAERRRNFQRGRTTHSEGGDQAGIILGIHNVSISAPQILATLISSVVFKSLQKPRGVVGDDSVGWVLRVGGAFALVAAYMTSRIEEEGAGD